MASSLRTDALSALYEAGRELKLEAKSMAWVSLLVRSESQVLDPEVAGHWQHCSQAEVSRPSVHMSHTDGHHGSDTWLCPPFETDPGLQSQLSAEL